MELLKSGISGMDDNLELYFLLLLLVVIPALFFMSRHSAVANSNARRRPPGPWALPLIGHLHHLAGTIPHRALHELARRHGPLMKLRLGELEVVVASSPDAAREIMKTHDANFASRPLTSMQQLAYQGNEGLVFAPYGDGWRQFRKICSNELLSSRSVQSFGHVREEELGGLLRSVAAAAAASSGLPVNLSQGISAYVADSTVRAVIGSRLKQRDTYLRVLQDFLGILSGMTLPDLFPSWRLALLLSSVPGRIRRHSKDMQQMMDTIIQERQEGRAAGQVKEEDFLDVLLRLQTQVGSQYPLTTENIKTVLQEMFGAGSETSATVLEWAMAELLRNPTVMRKAQGEVRQAFAGHSKVTQVHLSNLHYLRLVIKETLRLHPPAPLLLPRECESPCQVLGFDIPEGAMVIVNAWAIGRDPMHWDRPHEFVPERFEQNKRDFRGTSYEFLPFGAGRRVCPGISFGLAHVELALAGLLFHFDWKLPGGIEGKDLDMTEAFLFSSTRLRSHLLVVAAPRIPVPTKWSK